MAWIAAHASALVAIATALITLLSIVNGLIQAPRAKTFIGDAIDILSFIARAGAPGSVKLPGTRSCAPDALAAPPGASLRALLPFLLVATALAISGCGALKPLPEPTPAQYDAALKTCLTNAGALQALPVGEQLLQCFEQPGETVEQYEQCAEQDSGALAVDVVTVVTECAIDSWIDFTPQPANAAPSARLLAAREVRAKALARLIAQRGGR